MSIPSCSLSIMVARTDLPFLMHTVPHLVNACHFPFVERVLFVDTAPLSGDKVKRPGIGTLEALRDCCAALRDRGLVDRIVDMDYRPEVRERLYRKHLGLPFPQTHNWKGYPIFGTIYSLEAIAGDYLVHFDSDMLLHQRPDHDWISAGIARLQQHPQILAVRPMTGPPRRDGDGTMAQGNQPDRDPAGFYYSDFFGSRAYLIDRRRFDELLPLPIRWRNTRHRWYNGLPTALRTRLNYWTGKGELDSWEWMVTDQFRRRGAVRAWDATAAAWTVHPNTRSRDFLTALPRIIEQVEKGHYPPAQIGHYDLQVDAWIDWLESQPEINA
jgi:hypothetical protein